MDTEVTRRLLAGVLEQRESVLRRQRAFVENLSLIDADLVALTAILGVRAEHLHLQQHDDEQLKVLLELVVSHAEPTDQVLRAWFQRYVSSWVADVAPDDVAE